MTPKQQLEWSLNRIYDQCGLPRPTGKDKAICNLQAACIEAMGELEQGHPKEAHDTLQDALLEGI